MVDVVWLSYHGNVPHKGFWDYSFIEDLLNGMVWNPVGVTKFVHHDNFDKIKDACIVVVPARSHKGDVAQLNKDISRLRSVLIILMGDEDHEFPHKLLSHPNMIVWVMTPNEAIHGNNVRPLFNGYTPGTNKLIKDFEKSFKDRQRDVFFSGQVTHSRREQCAKAATALPDDIGVYFNGTEGFTQGLPREEYLQIMTGSKIVLCPSGPCTQDTFRVYEALESGSIPIVDAKTPKLNEYDGYWTYLFGEDPPFPVIHDWESLSEITKNTLDSWQNKANKTFAWWQRQKREVAYKLRDDLVTLGITSNDNGNLKDEITVVIPTSSIPSHPSTAILEETIASIRTHLPDCEILITFDGLRAEHAHRRDSYEEYKRDALFLCNFKWRNVLPVIFDEHMHQSGMLRSILPTVKTKTLLYVEQDTPLTPDCAIDFVGMVKVIESGQANTIRLHHEALIIPEHEHLMLDTKPQDVSGVPLVRTMQWSQRPHLMSTVAYRTIMDTYFTGNSRCFIEDKLHGEVQADCLTDGQMGWFKWRLFIYHPEGNIKRSYHLDGRAGEDKLDGTQVF